MRNNECRREVLPITFNRIDKLAQIVTPSLHLLFQISLGTNNDSKYKRSGVTISKRIYEDENPTYSMSIDSRDYLIMKFFDRDDNGKPGNVTICLTQLVLPRLSKMLSKCISYTKDPELFWIENQKWKHIRDKSTVKEFTGVKGKNKLFIFPDLFQRTSKSFLPSVCLQAENSGTGYIATVGLSLQEASDLAEYLNKLDLSVIGLQLTNMAIVANDIAKRKETANKKNDLTASIEESGKISVKQISLMNESQIDKLITNYGLEFDFKPEDLDHKKEALIEYLKSIGNLKGKL